MQRLLTTAALAVAAGLGLLSLSSAAKAQCSSLSYGIGSCVNQGYSRSSYSNDSSPSLSRYRSDNRPLLLEQPRFQPSFGSGYYGSSYRNNGW
jgi:hypothetical protein